MHGCNLRISFVRRGLSNSELISRVVASIYRPRQLRMNEKLGKLNTPITMAARLRHMAEDTAMVVVTVAIIPERMAPVVMDTEDMATARSGATVVAITESGRFLVDIARQR